MKGSILYPLNQLKEVDFDLYNSEVLKYRGREHIQQVIPNLNCNWNDVLHFSAVHPSKIYGELERLGKKYNATFYKIDPAKLDPKNTVVYLYQQKFGQDMSADNFDAYDPEKLDRYSTLPDPTKKYYKEMLDNGKIPLLYHRIPHILFKGSLETAGLEVVEV